MTTKIKNLQNKINDKTLTLEERENYFLDSQIEEIKFFEREEKRYLKKVDFIINNLNNKDYSFEIHYFIDDNYYSDFNFFKILYKKNNTQNFKIFDIYETTFFNNDYSFLKNEYSNKLFKYIENQKNNYVNDDEENEI